MLRLTPVVKNLLFITIAVFIGQLVAPAHDFGDCFEGGFSHTMDSITGYLSMWSTRTECFKPYQLFTYMFVHSPDGIMHILFNMLMLVFFGPILEEYFGQKRFLMLYTICGIGAGAFHILMNIFFGLGAFSTMLGASGAVYGVMTAFGITFPNMELRLLFLPFISFKAKYMVIVMGAITIYSGLRVDAGDNTAHLAHLGGIVVSIILIQIWRSRGTY
jgi:membrane associated rhomboid family serine protease